MISSTIPYKLTEILHDTWPQLYRPMKPPEELKDVNKYKKA
jgi:hypothetical protein